MNLGPPRPDAKRRISVELFPASDLGGVVLPMNSVRNRLALLIFVITAAAVGFIYLYVVPQLRSSLTAEKLRRLEQVATRAGPAARGRDGRRRLAGEHRGAAARTSTSGPARA